MTSEFVIQTSSSLAAFGVPHERRKKNVVRGGPVGLDDGVGFLDGPVQVLA
jgi:hypothetical protein